MILSYELSIPPMDPEVDGLDMKANCNDSGQTSFTIPNLSFATDLLYNLTDVQTYCDNGIATQQNVISLLKSRINLEKIYSTELAKIADQGHIENTEHGPSMKNALGTLRAQYLNTSVQHQIFAKNLQEDVLEPISQLFIHHGRKTQNLVKLIGNLRKQVKLQEEQYKKVFAGFEKQFREACVAFSSAMDAGFSSTLIQEQYQHQLEGTKHTALPLDKSQRHSHSMQQAIHEGDQEHVSVEKKSECDLNSERPRSRHFTSSHNGHNVVNWLLSSEQQRKKMMCANAIKTLQTAEAARVSCHALWDMLENGKLDMLRSMQSILTEYQQISEHRISNLAINLRKHVVFESSMLANEQYDWQMVAVKIENVDFEGDMRDFILNSARVNLSEMTVNDICNTMISKTDGMIRAPTSMRKNLFPVRKCPLQISDLATRRVPIDFQANQKPLASSIVVRALDNAPKKTETEDSAKEVLSHSEPSASCGATNTANDTARKSLHRVCLARDVARVLLGVHDALIQLSTTASISTLDAATLVESQSNSGSSPAVSDRSSESGDPDESIDTH
uniref:Uncharacterized protein AlNc14C123G6737 n=1 Tax=Albugo laibachii Nc14 TaxID=890382 RepID=F0WJL2_9STRA|nr:conserved hypothetical protein [Albugo laibachii Nc14]|eukprot:CCA21461.1 conserved hypothetical protein [Albugo laibachii Nc14]